MKLKTITFVTYDPTNDLEQKLFTEYKNELSKCGWEVLNVSKPTLGNEIEVSLISEIDFSKLNIGSIIK